MKKARKKQTPSNIKNFIIETTSTILLIINIIIILIHESKNLLKAIINLFYNLHH